MAAANFLRGPCRRAACALLLGSALLGAAHPQSLNGDAAAKAKFTVMLSRFVQWPAVAPSGDAATLRLCVFHNSPGVELAFARHGGETVGGRAVAIVPNPGAPAAPAAPCSVVFVDASASRQAADAARAAAGPAVLVVGAVDGFALQGGMVELVNVNDTLRFDVNLAALRAANLGLSSQVLKLARQVRE